MSRKIVVHPEILFEVEVRFKRKVNPVKVWIREPVAVEIVLHDADEIPVVAVLKEIIKEREYPLLKHGERFFVPDDSKPLPQDGISEALAKRFTQDFMWQWRDARADVSDHGVVAEIRDDSGRDEARANLLRSVASSMFVADGEGGWRALRSTTEPVLTVRDSHYQGRYSAWIGVDFPQNAEGYAAGRWRLDAEEEARASNRFVEREQVSGLVSILRPDLLAYDHHRNIAMNALGRAVESGRGWLERNLDVATVDEFAVWRNALDVWKALDAGGGIDPEDVEAVRALAAVADRHEDYGVLRHLDVQLAPTRHAVAPVDPDPVDGPELDDEDVEEEAEISFGL